MSSRKSSSSSEEIELSDSFSVKSGQTETKDQCYDKAIQNINTFGDDIKSLKNIKQHVALLRKKKETLENQLVMASNQTPSRVVSSLAAADQSISEGAAAVEEARALSRKADDTCAKTSQLLRPVADHLSLLHLSDKVEAYAQQLQTVQDICRRMNTLMKETPDTHITSPHLILHYTELLQLATVLKDSECLNLRKFVHQSLLYWHYILIQSTAKCVEKSLSDMQYPFQDGSHLVSEAQIASFTLAFTQLVLLYKTRPPVNAENFDGDGIDIKSLDDNIENSGEKSEQMVTAFNHVPKSSADEFCISEEAIMSDFEPLIMPLEYIFKPLEVRFMYHFSGKKKTNELAHPEWCLSKVLNWINVHESFFDDHLQPVLNRHELSHIKVKTEIARSLCALITCKMAREVPQVVENDDVFCHVLHQLLSFEADLRHSNAYSVRMPTVLRVLTQPQVFSHWLKLERQFAVALMDELTSDEFAWTSGEDCVPRCAEGVITLLHAITNRYKHLPQPGHRLQLLHTQLLVLDDFRVRLWQLCRPLHASPLQGGVYTAILCTVHHVLDTLSAWGERPNFLELQLYQSRCEEMENIMEQLSHKAPTPTSPDAPPSGNIFSGCAALYAHMRDEMRDTVLRHVATEIRARLQPYRRDTWTSTSSSAVSDVSPSLCPLLDVLGRLLQTLRALLSPPLLEDARPRLAAQLDRLLFEEVVLQNQWGGSGALQFHHDMHRALYLMFAEYDAKPRLHFPLTDGSTSLLLLPLAPALLLRDTLRDAAAPPASGAQALAEHGARGLGKGEALALLEERLDLAKL